MLSLAGKCPTLGTAKFSHVRGAFDIIEPGTFRVIENGQKLHGGEWFIFLSTIYRCLYHPEYCQVSNVTHIPGLEGGGGDMELTNRSFSC